jgi:hypothetical protein
MIETVCAGRHRTGSLTGWPILLLPWRPMRSRDRGRATARPLRGHPLNGRCPSAMSDTVTASAIVASLYFADAMK